MLSKLDLNYLDSVNNLSIKNLGLTGANPSVACLIVDYKNNSQGVVLSYGLTSKSGRPHAEINALNKVSNYQINNQTTMYVSLEPCFKANSCCSKKIINGVGFIMKNNDYQSIIKNLKKVIKIFKHKKKEWKYLKKNSRLQIQKNFSIPNMANTYLKNWIF